MTPTLLFQITGIIFFFVASVSLVYFIIRHELTLRYLRQISSKISLIRLEMLDINNAARSIQQELSNINSTMHEIVDNTLEKDDNVS